MKFQTLFAAIFAIAAASPIAQPDAEALAEPVEHPVLLVPNQPLAARQASSTANELSNGACRRITFIFARGSTEPGNLGTSVGPGTCNQLKSRYGTNNVACQGVGNPYAAGLLDNALPQGTTPAAIGEATRLFNLANTKCPNTIITAGGYSQGGAVMHGSIRSLSTALKNKIAGVVLYGDSRNAQDGGQIPTFDRSKTDIICASGDPICRGTLTVTAAHLSYGDDVDEGAAFLASKIGN